MECNVVSFQAAFGKRDVVLLTLDALRFDVAHQAMQKAKLPNFAALLPQGFEARQTPGTFTFAAHQAFFAGFFPTPAHTAPQQRPMALRFPGSRTTGPTTLLLEGTSIVAAFAQANYRTICIGGTGFFNPQTPLGTVLPALFQEAHFGRDMGVTSPVSAEVQFALAQKRLGELPDSQRVFLFVNVSATHPPTRIFHSGAKKESCETQTAALCHIDRHLPVLTAALKKRGGAVGIVCSDHGTCFGEAGDDGYVGHRIAHPNVLTVPYAEFEVSA